MFYLLVLENLSLFLFCLPVLLMKKPENLLLDSLILLMNPEIKEHMLEVNFIFMFLTIGIF